MARRKTHEEFVEELKLINPDIDVLEQYINTDTKIKVKCKICNNVWSVRPSDLLRNVGCPKCKAKQSGLKRTKTHEQFKTELYSINNNIEVLGKYINNHTKIKVKCKCCEHIWHTTPNLLVGKNNTGCPICSIKIQTMKRTKSHDKFVSEVNETNPNIETLGTYINNHTKIEMGCKVCGCIWSALPNDLIGKNATGCPNCNISKGEREISSYLQLLSIENIPQKTFEGLFGTGGGLLSYDFYLPTYNMLIEYQGDFHDGSIKSGFQTSYMLKKQQEHDRRKKLYAKDHNIKLLEIWYWDFDNIKQILNEQLNINNNEKSA